MDTHLLPPSDVLSIPPGASKPTEKILPDFDVPIYIETYKKYMHPETIHTKCSPLLSTSFLPLARGMGPIDEVSSKESLALPTMEVKKEEAHEFEALRES